MVGIGVFTCGALGNRLAEASALYAQKSRKGVDEASEEFQHAAVGTLWIKHAGAGLCTSEPLQRRPLHLRASPALQGNQAIGQANGCVAEVAEAMRACDSPDGTNRLFTFTVQFHAD
eukprot:8558613-Alexandrium_andersonii.AAC.1